MLAVIDYGGGNLGSLTAGLTRRSADFCVTDDPQRIRDASGTILPGDGAFAATMDALRERGLDRAIRASIDRGTPYLGICVGMQVLFEGSDEFGEAAGLGVLAGRVGRFMAAPRVPHMGWNRLELTAAHPFVAGVDDGDYAYFLHSYRAPLGAATVAAATHGERFSAVVARGNVMGTQFHPEKSQHTGAKLIDNFVRLCASKENRG